MNIALQAFIVPLNKQTYDFEGKLRSNFTKEVFYAYNKRHLYNILKELDLYSCINYKRQITIFYQKKKKKKRNLL